MTTHGSSLADASRMSSGTSRGVRARVNGTLTICSALLYTFAFNLIFFIQELFLVVPKALTPGLRPTLYHNNHQWEGDHPLASLFQGTGALAIVIVAVTLAVWLTRYPPRSTTRRLFLIWMIFHGCFESIPQVIVGAFLPRNDVGMAMTYLRFTPAARHVAALLACVAIVAIGMWLTRPILGLAQHPDEIDSPSTRTRFVFRVATLPALSAVPLIILFRVPGSIDQVAIVPIAVTVIGITWIQAFAWRIETVRAGEATPVRSVRGPLIAVAIQFVIFQVMLRPGIPFF